MKKYILLLIAIILLAGCSSKKLEDINTGPYQIKEEAVIYNHKIVITNVYFLDKFCILHDGEDCLVYRESSNGKYLVIDVKLSSNGGLTISPISQYFELQDKSGNKRSEGLITSLDDPLPDDLAPGNTISGEIYFDVEESDSYSLFYNYYDGTNDLDIEFIIQNKNINQYVLERDYY